LDCWRIRSRGYRVDFSVDSLKEIDRFFDEHALNGGARPGGLLAENCGSRLFALGGYVGETIRRSCGGEWFADDTDPQGEINIEIRLHGGARLWPVQRLMKRYKKGPEDGIYVHGCALARRGAE
jgi:hypothetical protein